MFDWLDGEMDDHAVYRQDGLYIPDAGECLRCGFCVSGCPTYQLFKIDAETPRSRIRTIDKILNSNDLVSATELEHLNNCTQCRACEAICPSRMNYGQLFDLAREKLNQNSKMTPDIAFKFIEHKALMFLAAIVCKLYQSSGLQFLFRKSRLLRLLKLEKAEALLPETDISFLRKRYPAAQRHRGNVALFTGCIGNHFDRRTLLASIKLLNHIGYGVLIAQEQGCCGAIHQHQGRTEMAKKMANSNRNVFDLLAVDAIIYTASGCGLMLSEYEPAFKKNLFDIAEFLNLHWPEQIKLQAYPGNVTVHEPCSQRNSLKNQQHVYDLLNRIPEITLSPLPDNQLCCGAGGVHMLTHPEIAYSLRDAKISLFKQSPAGLLVSSNIGCILHLNTGMDNAQVIHPLVLLAAQV
ncbi:MAG: (Fe-S)-binding protein [Methylococcaceae bacterium]